MNDALKSAMRKLTTGEVGRKLAALLADCSPEERGKLLRLAAVERELRRRKALETPDPAPRKPST